MRKNLLNFTKLLVVFFAALAANSANAATFTVTNTNDTGAGSLRDAIAQANSNAQADTINFDAAFFNTPRTIVLASEIQITADGANPGRALTINGPSANLLTVSGNNATRPFYLLLNSNVSMSGMTLRDGNGVGTILSVEGRSGGAIIGNLNYLTLRNMVIRNNSVTGSGGTMFLNAVRSFTMTDSLVTENFAVVYGGGIYSSFGEVNTIRNSVVSNNSTDNQVGGLAIERGVTTIENCQITGNRAGLASGGTNAIGGLALFMTAATVTDTLISNNTVGVSTVNGGSIGGVSADSGNMTFRRVTVSGNTAYGNDCGMFLRGGGSIINVIDSTISNNQTINPQFLSFTLGGGLRVTGAVNLINSTVANNKAGAGYGGGAAVEGGTRFNVINVINATITGNIAERSDPNNNADGGGIFDITLVSGATPPETPVQNSIIALNAGPGGPDLSGTFISNGYNIIGNTANSTGFGAAGDKLNVIRCSLRCKIMAAQR